MNRKGFIAGAVFGLLVISVREVVTPATNRLVASLFLISLGLLLTYGGKRFEEWYRPKYEQEFRDNPAQRMGWDILWMILTRRAPILYIFVSPFGGFFTGWGLVQLTDAALIS